jgi:hypothetical protein
MTDIELLRRVYDVFEDSWLNDDKLNVMDSVKARLEQYEEQASQYSPAQIRRRMNAPWSE